MRIKDISAGTSHAAMVDEMNRVFTWGLGSYGRNAGAACRPILRIIYNILADL